MVTFRVHNKTLTVVDTRQGRNHSPLLAWGCTEWLSCSCHSEVIWSDFHQPIRLNNRDVPHIALCSVDQFRVHQALRLWPFMEQAGTGVNVHFLSAPQSDVSPLSHVLGGVSEQPTQESLPDQLAGIGGGA